ncbi:MAG: Photosystem I reaction center subunit III [Cyanobacteria bacterium P01_F01_bin.150]
MRRLFALAIVLCLFLGFTPPASADVAGLTPCSESPAFQGRAAAAPTPQAKRRFEFYANAGLLCGEEGLPHLVVDGRWDHAGEFMIPGLLFLYIAGWIGWVGRSYLLQTRGEKDPAMKEIIIDVPLAFNTMMAGVIWPIDAFKAVRDGEMSVPDDKLNVSRR